MPDSVAHPPDINQDMYLLPNVFKLDKYVESIDF